jgi:hypothetical protein
VSHDQQRAGVVPSPNRGGTRQIARAALLERENAQLREALASRVAIEQAKGVLAERFHLDLEQAFNVLRAAARANRMRIHALAATVTSERTTTPPEISAAVHRLARRNGGRPVLDGERGANVGTD